MNRLIILVVLLLLIGCSNKKSQCYYVKGKVTGFQYKTIGFGYYKTKFLFTYRYHGNEEEGFAFGKTHQLAIPECYIGDSILVKLKSNNIDDATVVDIFFRRKNKYGQPVDTIWRRRYDHLE